MVYLWFRSVDVEVDPDVFVDITGLLDFGVNYLAAAQLTDNPGAVALELIQEGINPKNFQPRFPSMELYSPWIPTIPGFLPQNSYNPGIPSTKFLPLRNSFYRNHFISGFL